MRWLCRVVLICVYLFIITFVVVDLFLVSHAAYNLVSLCGIFVLIILLFAFSHSPAKVRSVVVNHSY